MMTFFSKLKLRDAVFHRRSWFAGFALFWGIILPLTSNAAPIVTIIDDDARSEQAIESVKEVADRCGVKVTFAPVAAFLKQNSKIAERLLQYVSEGHEIASHSLTHSPKIWKAGAATDIQAIENEMIESEEIFHSFGLQPKTFVYPYGNFPRDVRSDIFRTVGKYYSVAFNARGDINLPGEIHPLYISRHPLRKHNSLFMTEHLIDEAVKADSSWVVILTHSANSDFSPEMLENIIRYAQQSGAVFLTASAAWQQVKTWSMMSEDQIPDYSRFGDYVNAAYFHLPLLLGIGTVFAVSCCIVFYLSHRCIRRRRRNKATALPLKNNSR